MSTPELKPETPLTTELCRSIGKSGVDWHHSATLVADFARKLESALNAAREAIENAPHTQGCNANCPFGVNPRLWVCNCWKSKALAQISPQQSKTT